MNNNSHNSISNRTSPAEVSQHTTLASSLSTPFVSGPIQDDEPTTAHSTYDSFSWLFNYIKMFATRLANDIYTSAMIYWYPDREFLPSHIVHLMQVQSRLHAEPDSHTVTYSRQYQDQLPSQSPIRNFYNELRSYILSSEDVTGLQFADRTRNYDYTAIEREPMFVIVDSSCVSNPSSKEILVDDKINFGDNVLRKRYDGSANSFDVPSTSKDMNQDVVTPQLKESDSTDELQMVDINLQSDNDLLIVDNECDNDSIVISYLKNKSTFSEFEGAIMSTKKKSSLLESVPKMETILESEQFSAVPMTSKTDYTSNMVNNGNKTM